MKPSEIAKRWLEGSDQHNAEDHRPYDDLARAYLLLRYAAMDMNDVFVPTDSGEVSLKCRVEEALDEPQ